LLIAALLPAAFCRAEVSAEQMRVEARLCRDRSNEAIQMYENLVARLAHHSEFMRPDLLQAKTAYEAASEAWRTAADAYDEQDTTAAAAARTAAEATGRGCNVWRDRLETREKQAAAAPQEGTWCQLQFNTGPEGKAALGALVEAQKEASEAWGFLADATLPNADREKLAILLEQAQQKVGEVELAAAAYATIDRRERLARKGDPSSPRVTEALDALKKLDDERAVMQREEIARAARLRELDRRRIALEEQVKQAYDEAKKAGEKKP
jgi:hypothetical protein